MLHQLQLQGISVALVRFEIWGEKVGATRVSCREIYGGMKKCPHKATWRLPILAHPSMLPSCSSHSTTLHLHINHIMMCSQQLAITLHHTSDPPHIHHHEACTIHDHRSTNSPPLIHHSHNHHHTTTTHPVHEILRADYDTTHNSCTHLLPTPHYTSITPHQPDQTSTSYLPHIHTNQPLWHHMPSKPPHIHNSLTLPVL